MLLANDDVDRNGSGKGDALGRMENKRKAGEDITFKKRSERA